MSQTQSQRRAAAALQEVKKIEKLEDAKLKDRFRSYAQSLPAMIQMNGLGQTAAFCRSRTGASDQAYRELYDVMSNWLTYEGQPYAKQKDLLEALTAGPMGPYRAAQVEILAYLDWVKRFAAAFLHVPDESPGETADATGATSEGSHA